MLIANFASQKAMMLSKTLSLCGQRWIRCFSTNEKNYVDRVHILPDKSYQSIFVSSAVINSSTILPGQYRSGFCDQTGHSLVLTYLDQHYVNHYGSLPAHSIIGWISNQSGIRNDFIDEFQLSPKHFLTNNSFKEFFHHCYQKFMIHTYDFHTSKIEFEKLSPNDYIKCYVVDGRINLLNQSELELLLSKK